MSPSHKIPFEDISWTFWFFIEKLYKQLLHDGVRDVFFLAREGDFLKQLFDLYQKDLAKDLFINTYFFLVSRRATFLPSLRPLSGENFARLFSKFLDFSLNNFLRSLNFSSDDIQQVLAEMKVDQNTLIRSFKDSETLQLLLQNQSFQKLYEQKRIEQKQKYIGYLQSFPVELEKGMHVVDIGWHGSIQDNMFHILDEEIPISGYYLGLVKHADMSLAQNDKKGLLFSYFPTPTKYYSVYSHNCSLFELIAGTPHGMVLSYVKNNNTFQAVLDEGKEEIDLFHSKIVPIQKRILAYFERFTLLSDQEREYLIAKGHARMVFLHSKTEIDFFRSLYHFEKFGLFQKTYFQHIFSNNTLSPICWRLLTLYNTKIPFLWRVYGWFKYLRHFI